MLAWSSLTEPSASVDTPDAPDAPDARPCARVRAFLMGTDAEVTVAAETAAASASLAEHGIDELHHLETLWSRFRPDSDVARITSGAGGAVGVDGRTAALVALACRASDATGAAFSPLVGLAMTGNGYDRPWQEGWASSEVPASHGTRGLDYRMADVAGVRVERGRSATVRIPSGTALDLGGIAKGHAADRVATMLVGLGASSVVVNVGGDIRVIGGPHAVAVDDPEPADQGTSRPFTVWTLRNGGVATSSALRRRWQRAGRGMHHVVDPLDGTPSDGPRYVTVLAGTAADAEVLTKVGMVAGRDALRGWCNDAVESVLVESDGSRWRLTRGRALSLVAPDHRNTRRTP